MESVHVPVLLAECLEYLAPEEGQGLLVDCTLGEGGHSEAFLRAYPALRVLAIDADAAARARAAERLAPFGARIDIRAGYFDEVLPGLEAEKPDLVLMDLGISIFHYELSGRGFSFRKDEPVDMRINPAAGKSAAELLAGLREEELAELLWRYGEERYSRRIARAVVEARKSGGIRTASALADLIWGAVPKDYRHGRLHPATRSFQALRIAVNDELGRLERGIEEATRILAPGGKLGIISFHSLEDGIVKRRFRELSRDCVCPPEVQICECGGKRAFDLVVRKGVEAGQAEIEANPPSRSARLRVIRKLFERGGAKC